MIKNVLIVLFIIVGMFVIYNFKDHNQKRAIDACIAGSQKLEKPMTVPEAKIFCEEQIKNNKWVISKKFFLNINQLQW